MQHNYFRSVVKSEKRPERHKANLRRATIWIFRTKPTVCIVGGGHFRIVSRRAVFLDATAFQPPPPSQSFQLRCYDPRYHDVADRGSKWAEINGNEILNPEKKLNPRTPSNRRAGWRQSLRVTFLGVYLYSFGLLLAVFIGRASTNRVVVQINFCAARSHLRWQIAWSV